MIIHLNKNLSTPNTLNKVLSPSKQFNVTLKDETNLLYPSVLISGKLYNFHDYNYAYIPSFGRYYFIVETVSVTNKLVSLSLKVDVLMSWRDSLKNCQVLVSRQEKKYNTFFYDSKLPQLAYTNTVIKKFPRKFQDHPSYILALRG